MALRIPSIISRSRSPELTLSKPHHSQLLKLGRQKPSMEPIGKAALNVTQSRQHLTDTSRALSEKRAETTKQARLLLGCYRTGDANDPEVYTAGVIAVLSTYPMEVVRLVCDPRSGLPSKVKWLPTIAEVRDECEAWHGPMRRAAARQASIEVQLQDRAEAEQKRSERPTYDELKAKHGASWGLNPSDEAIAEDPRRAERAREFSNRDIQREYDAHGEKPYRVGDLLISRSLVKLLKGAA